MHPMDSAAESRPKETPGSEQHFVQPQPLGAARPDAALPGWLRQAVGRARRDAGRPRPAPVNAAVVMLSKARSRTGAGPPERLATSITAPETSETGEATAAGS